MSILVGDKSYWNKFYNLKVLDSNCSDFCLFVMNYFKNNDDILYLLDAGCGNGRDSYELVKKYKVDGINNSGFIPKIVNKI